MEHTEEHEVWGVEPDEDALGDLPEAPGATRIEKFRAIVDQRSLMCVDGQPVDLFSASTVVQLHDAFQQDSSRQGLMAIPSVPKLVRTAFAVLERARSR